MKNFKKQFMELTLVFAVINSVTLVKAFAQEIDYNDINRQNAEISSTQVKEKSKLKKFLFTDRLGNISLPKNRKLTAIEKDQKKLVECALKFIDKRKGFYEGVEVLQSILVKAMDSEKLTSDSYVLNEATRECLTANKNLTSFKKRDTKFYNLNTALKSLSRSTPAEAKTASFLTKQYHDEFQCIAHEVSASVGIFLGVNAGASLLKCINPAGEVRNYVGPKIGVSDSMAGAKVAYTKKKNASTFITGVIAGSAASRTSDGNIFVVFGADNNDYYNEETGYESDYKQEGQNIGLGIDAREKYVTLNIRLFNSSRNWSFVIDQLK